MYKLSRLHAALVMTSTLSLVAAGGVHAEGSAGVATKVTDAHFTLAPGYMAQAELPDSLVLLGAPPAIESAAFARDEEARRAALSLRGSARWELAKTDAALNFPRPAENFSCAMGISIDEKILPRTYQIMQRVLTDAGLSTYGVKNTYNRTRPFALHDEGTCTPEDEAVLRSDGSYPSGHTAAGWAWALVLAEINPASSNALLARGLSFGQSRVICNAHWQSDVDAGRIMGAATVARLHSDPDFLADVAAAQAEVQSAKAAGVVPLDCALENTALAPAQH